ncbi:type VI secretion system ImpA family N-terminal domain-containing protein [Dongshaea marina]|uniref:type VI secretion system ImpA family N-terminal domain-containing protein n=1 Tax=Dongshaea marina TaxID=2047966 RepID=UPI000D3E5974|nr:type VI secretion system ImpA family N-terminal domain-containing protein [Dongshaea marina]
MITDDIRALGTQPVSEQSPGGENATLDPDMDALQLELDKLNSISQASEISWPRVESLAESLLKNRSKHFQVAAYWGVARLHNHGFEAIAEAAVVLQGLVETFWDCAWPPKKRMRGRMLAIEWWLDAAGQWVSDYQGEPIDEATQVVTLESIDRLEYALTERNPDAPMMRSLINGIKRLPLVAPVSESAAKPVEADSSPSQEHPTESGASNQVEPNKDVQPASAPAQSSAPATPASSPVADSAPSSPSPELPICDPGGDESPDKELARGMSAFIHVAELLFRADPSSADSYRYRRIGSWCSLKTPPIRGRKPAFHRLPAMILRCCSACLKRVTGTDCSNPVRCGSASTVTGWI